MTTLGALSWSMSGTRFYSSSLSGRIKKGTSVEGYNNIISNLYHADNASSLNQLTDGGISVDSGGNVQLRDDRFSSTSDLIASMGNTQLCYELAEPIEYTTIAYMTYTFPGQNNIWADTGNVEVTYFSKEE